MQEAATSAKLRSLAYRSNPWPALFGAVLALVAQMARRGVVSPFRTDRVAVPVEIRRALAKLGKMSAVKKLRISPITYDEVVVPSGYMQAKILAKIEVALRELERDAT